MKASKLVIGGGVLLLCITSAANASSNMAYREHLLNARAHLEQAKLALDRAEQANSGELRYSFNVKKGKEPIQEVIDGIDYYFEQPLRPQISPEQFTPAKED